MPQNHPHSPTWQRLEDVPGGDAWRRLGGIANERIRLMRERSGMRVSQETLASVGGPSGALFRKMKGKGHPISTYVPGLETALHWPSGHALKILSGGEDDAPLPAQADILTIIYPPGTLPTDTSDLEDVRLAARRAGLARVKELRDTAP